MFTSYLLALVLLAFQPQPCLWGHVVGVNLGGLDYTIDICGVGVVALREVDPSLTSCTRSLFGRSVSGEV